MKPPDDNSNRSIKYTIPWGTFIGFCFGEGRYSTGLVALSLQVAVSLVDGYIWFWVLENMKDKIEKDPVKSANKVTA